MKNTARFQLILMLGMIHCVSLIALGNQVKPNIIYIMSDDHAADAVGVYGGRYADLDPTPNIDRLAREGVQFTQVFCNNSICVPSRASILTGQYPQTNGVLCLDGQLPPEKQYLPQELKKLGYSTAIIGKWHLKEEPAAFDYYKVLPVQGKYFDPEFREKGKGAWPENIVKTQGHSSDVITDEVIEYIKGLDPKKPFFVMHHFKAPHGPFDSAKRYEDYLEKTEIPEPASLYNQPDFGSAGSGQTDEWKSVIGTSMSPRHAGERHGVPSSHARIKYPDLEAKQATHLVYQRSLKRYLRCVKGVDDNVGKLFDFLKKSGLWDNTIIVYTSDQGMMLGAHDFADKRWMYEESMQMPFVMKGVDGHIHSEVSDLLVNNTDFAPTMIDLAGGKVPDDMQGRSFKNTLIGKPEKDWRTATYYRYWMHMIHHWVPAHFGIRTKDYKLLFYYGKHYLADEEHEPFYWAETGFGQKNETPHTWEFYDLKNDPGEMDNRYDDPDYQEVIAKLKKELKRQREELNETDENYPEIQDIINEHWKD